MRRLGLSLCLVGLFAPLAARGDSEGDRLFRERVAPVLERRCVHCHGDASPKGGLSLTTAEAVRKGGKAGPAIVSGKPDESLLLDAVTGDPPEMPKKGPPLAVGEVADLRAWIDQGARWPEGLTLRDRRFEGEKWWAFAPLMRPPIPVVKATEWVRTPVDAFILAGLEMEGLAPSAEADRRTLIRRLAYDLHGLPAKPGEVDDFLGDRRPDAYERLVDRLLDSPRYGERMGRYWLDVVHYGDTHGYDKDKRRDHAWPYRDYVIRAFNADVPYAKFVRQQVAGDVIDRGNSEGVIAAGFISAGPWDFVGHVELREDTVDKAKARLNDRDDMLSNTMSTFQSLTVHCARCHDHKFDPIPQAEYYQLQAVFAGVERGDRAYSTVEIDAKREAMASRRREAIERLGAINLTFERLSGPALAERDGALRELRQGLAALAPPTPAGPSPSPTNGYHSGIHPGSDGAAWVQVDLGAPVAIDEIRLVPARPTDFADTPGFGFPTQWTVALSDDPSFPASATEVVAKDARDERRNAADEPYIVRPDGRKARYVRVSASRLWKRMDDYVFALGEVEVISAGENVARNRTVTSLDSIEAGRWSRNALVDGFDSRGERPLPAHPNATRRAALLYMIQQAEAERERLAESSIPPALRAERDALNAKVRAVDEAIKSLASNELVYSVLPRPPRPIHLLRRGDVEQPGEASKAGALSCVSGLESLFTLARPDDEGARRAALADWLASEKNVLTWRSIANRVWSTHFGRGIVDTPNDFGRNGSKPTHPELLDWLAAELLENGQSLKGLHRVVVTSAAYRQRSLGNASGEAKDAENRWVWRQNRRRLDAESVRDGILAVSGTLDTRMEGPGFDLFRFKDDHSPVYDHTAPGAADNPRVRRRTIYRFTVRSVPNPFLECLDSADPNLNTPVRATTITALQALALLNDAFIVSQSKAFAARLEGRGGDLGAKIEAAYLLVLGRPPHAGERAGLAGYARKFGLAGACRVLLNTNEFMFVD